MQAHPVLKVWGLAYTKAVYLDAMLWELIAAGWTQHPIGQRQPHAGTAAVSASLTKTSKEAGLTEGPDIFLPAGAVPA